MQTGPILLVEDIPNVLELLEVTLRFKGYRVNSSADGLEALEAIQRERPALVITDILMPRLDGYALVYRLRSNPETRSIPIIFLSATYVSPDDRDFALKLGAVRFIEKPIDTEEFLLTVAEVLAQGPNVESTPLQEELFYQGYRERLEQKLRHKNSQIERLERVIPTLPKEQKPSFKKMLEQAKKDAETIKAELQETYRILDELKGKA
jgi:CheY-like chemotaxis protein